MGADGRGPLARLRDWLFGPEPPPAAPAPQAPKAPRAAKKLTRLGADFDRLEARYGYRPEDKEPPAR